MHPSFQLYEEATPELVAFLSAATLGTNGAKYQHLDTSDRIQELENPLHLSLIRNEKITFARRKKNWYVRYFAFDKLLQSTGKNTSARAKKSVLKNELASFFRTKFENGEAECFYSYIDPSNDKSHQAAVALGFRKSDTVYTQTFSRVRPKASLRMITLNIESSRKFIDNKFKTEKFYHETKAPGRSYCLKNDDGEIIAFANASPLNWKIHRLPGRFGQLFVSVLPYIPILSSIINPKNFTFLGIDHVWVQDSNSALLSELLSSILKIEHQKMLIWWTDKRVLKHSDHVRWGVMHALLKTNPVDVYTIDNNLTNMGVKHFSVAKDFS